MVKIYSLTSVGINMNMVTTLNEIASLSIEDRILLVQTIWDGIAAEQAYPDLTVKQKQELDRRIDDLDANPDNVMTWEEIKASIKGQ
jgi:putative addiction module component (TIGR02574 family)